MRRDSGARKGAAGKTVSKHNLPVKTCAACGRPFTWRKKWERVWDEVRFCSDRCRGKR
jgi:hypothetical protein